MDKNKPIIGIVTRPEKIDCKYDAHITYEKIRRIIVKSGGIPISISPSDNNIYSLDNYNKEELSNNSKLDIEKVINLCDGIVFQGGNKWYSYDEYIASYAIKNDIPTLGICLGMQLLSFIDNNQKPILIDSEINHSQTNVDYVHEIKILPNTLLFGIIKKENIMVNSSHKYTIDNLNEFKVCAKSSDGVIEAIYHPKKKFILGLQFHPETMFAHDENKFSYSIFSAFIDSCK